jgi:hypothetical protein
MDSAKTVATFFVVFLLFASITCGLVLRTQAGSPANVAFLSGQTQQLLWKNGKVAVFRATDGSEKLVETYTAPLEIGAKYEVEVSPRRTKLGYFYTYSLKKI